MSCVTIHNLFAPTLVFLYRLAILTSSFDLAIMVSALRLLVLALTSLPSIVSAWPVKVPRQANVTATAQGWINENLPGKYEECTAENMEVRKDW